MTTSPDDTMSRNLCFDPQINFKYEPNDRCIHVCQDGCWTRLHPLTAQRIAAELNEALLFLDQTMTVMPTLKVSNG